jgi:hypothetical protein
MRGSNPRKTTWGDICVNDPLISQEKLPLIPSRTAGQRGERNEAGEDLAAVTHKIDQSSLHTASRRAGMAGTG